MFRRLSGITLHENFTVALGQRLGSPQRCIEVMALKRGHAGLKSIAVEQLVRGGLYFLVDSS